ncbi:MAG TPA: hypothetical protein VGP33_13615 [Chloroflexota bacterium]|nr:hypothetical protein [Chloroflexota bacterium]
MLADHPHVRVVLNSAQRYREATLSIDGLQQNLAAIARALEGDIPSDVRAVIQKAEAELESLRFGGHPDQEAARVGQLLCEIEQVIHRYNGSATVGERPIGPGFNASS